MHNLKSIIFLDNIFRPFETSDAIVMKKTAPIPFAKTISVDVALKNSKATGKQTVSVTTSKSSVKTSSIREPLKRSLQQPVTNYSARLSAATKKLRLETAETSQVSQTEYNIFRKELTSTNCHFTIHKYQQTS